MGLLDTILGRSKPVRANLDALFALPSAAVTLQISAGLVPTGRAGVCFKPPAGQPFAEMQAELEQLLETPDASSAAPPAPATPAPAPPTPAPPTPTPPPIPDLPSAPVASAPSGSAANLTVRHVGDRFGYRWILVEGGAIDDLVTRVHMVHSSLEDAGWSTQLLCSVFGFSPTTDTGGEAPPDAVTRPVYIVYLAKRGTFYPFAPTGEEQRDTELELRIRSILGNDLPVEADLSRWFPIWDLPVT